MNMRVYLHIQTHIVTFVLRIAQKERREYQHLDPL